MINQCSAAFHNEKAFTIKNRLPNQMKNKQTKKGIVKRNHTKTQIKFYTPPKIDTSVSILTRNLLLIDRLDIQYTREMRSRHVMQLNQFTQGHSAQFISAGIFLSGKSRRIVSQLSPSHWPCAGIFKQSFCIGLRSS